MSTIPCGTVAMQGRTLTGFSGDVNAIAALREAAMKADPQTSFAVRHLPWPQCEAALTLAAPLARDGTTIAALTEAGDPRAGDPVAMKENDIFGVSATTTAARPYLSIIYLQADGSAVELHRGHPEPDRKGVRRVTIGLSKTAQRYQVAPPFGPEMIVAIASDKPLFGDDEVVNGTERQFLTRLRAKLAGRRGGDLSAAYVRLQTSN
jgi:hypothetical protein